MNAVTLRSMTVMQMLHVPTQLAILHVLAMMDILAMELLVQVFI